MIEAGVAVVGIIIFGSVAGFSVVETVHLLKEERLDYASVRGGVLLFVILAVPTLYFLVRFVRWAWLTSIPFISSL